VNKTSVESTAQDNFQVVKRRKRHIFSNISQTAKKSTKPVPTSAAVNMPKKKTVLNHNFLTLLRTTNMDTETTEAEKTLPEQEAPRKPGTPPPIMMTYTINFIRFQSDLKEHVR
jgi:hypothetical protein